MSQLPGIKYQESHGTVCPVSTNDFKHLFIKRFAYEWTACGLIFPPQQFQMIKRGHHERMLDPVFSDQARNLVQGH